MPSSITIPVQFEYEGIYFEGNLSSSTGNEHVWNLVLYGFLYGGLVKYSTGWQWCSNGKAPMFLDDYMKDFFVSVVENYLSTIL